MELGGPFFILAIIAITTAGWIVTTAIRARHGYPVENEWHGLAHRSDVGADVKRQVELIVQENEALRGQVTRLQDRVAVLERLATDPASRLDREIAALRG